MTLKYGVFVLALFCHHAQASLRLRTGDIVRCDYTNPEGCFFRGIFARIKEICKDPHSDGVILYCEAGGKQFPINPTKVIVIEEAKHCMKQHLLFIPLLNDTEFNKIVTNSRLFNKAKLKPLGRGIYIWSRMDWIKRK